MYSQNNEEEIILNFFKDKPTGIYLDVGAGDWQEYSNTLALYQKGWHGFAIDPFELYADGWVRNRPRDKFLLLALSDYDGRINMSDTMMEGADYFEEYIEVHHKPVRTVDCKKLSTLCVEYPELLNTDFLSMDIETSEKRIIPSIDFHRFKPSLICIEHKVRGIENTQRWVNFLIPFYELIAETPGNAFYKRV